MRSLLTIFFFTTFHLFLFAQQKDSVYNSQMQLPGVKMITVFGKYKVWTQKIGSGKIKILLLHGGPGNTHEYLEGLAKYLSQNGIEVYLYDQLGSYFSDQPKVIKGDTIWKMSSRIEEVEEVRKAVGLDDFYLYGHSYGAILGLAYLHKYPQNVKGYIFSSMNTDTAAENARNNVVSAQIDSLLRVDRTGKEIMKKKDNNLSYDTTTYEGLSDKLYLQDYLCRTATVPESLKRMSHHNNYMVGGEIRRNLYQSPEYNIQLNDIKTPVLVIAGKYDFTASESDLESIHQKLINSRLFICQNSGHMSMLDDSDEYDKHILQFLTDVETKKF